MPPGLPPATLENGAREPAPDRRIPRGTAARRCLDRRCDPPLPRVVGENFSRCYTARGHDRSARRRAAPGRARGENRRRPRPSWHFPGLFGSVAATDERQNLRQTHNSLIPHIQMVGIGCRLSLLSLMSSRDASVDASATTCHPPIGAKRERQRQATEPANPALPRCRFCRSQRQKPGFDLFGIRNGAGRGPAAAHDRRRRECRSRRHSAPPWRSAPTTSSSGTSVPRTVPPMLRR